MTTANCRGIAKATPKHEAHQRRFKAGRVYMIIELVPESERPPSVRYGSGLHTIEAFADEPSSVRNALPVSNRRTGS